eukprot:1173925-Prorocentrum_minimum.AAC.7
MLRWRGCGRGAPPHGSPRQWPSRLAARGRNSRTWRMPKSWRGSCARGIAPGPGELPPRQRRSPVALSARTGAWREAALGVARGPIRLRRPIGGRQFPARGNLQQAASLLSPPSGSAQMIRAAACREPMRCCPGPGCQIARCALPNGERVSACEGPSCTFPDLACLQIASSSIAYETMCRVSATAMRLFKAFTSGVIWISGRSTLSPLRFACSLWGNVGRCVNFDKSLPLTSTFGSPDATERVLAIDPRGVLERKPLLPLLPYEPSGTDPSISLTSNPNETASGSSGLFRLLNLGLLGFEEKSAEEGASTLFNDTCSRFFAAEYFKCGLR